MKRIIAQDKWESVLKNQVLEESIDKKAMLTVDQRDEALTHLDEVGRACNLLPPNQKEKAWDFIYEVEKIVRDYTKRDRTAQLRQRLIDEGYDVDEQGIIRTPGKFEAEWFPVVYFYEMIMDGDTGIGDYDFGEGETYTIFKIMDTDLIEVPELKAEGLNIGDRVAIETNTQGFISLVTEITDEDIARLDRAMEDYGEGEMM